MVVVLEHTQIEMKLTGMEVTNMRIQPGQSNPSWHLARWYYCKIKINLLLPYNVRVGKFDF